MSILKSIFAQHCLSYAFFLFKGILNILNIHLKKFAFAVVFMLLKREKILVESNQSSLRYLCPPYSVVFLYT